jgi:hypothetical protein
VQYFESALASLGRLPQDRERQELSVDMRLGLRGSLFPLGQLDAGLQHLGDAERIATEQRDKRRLASISAYVSEQHRPRRGRHRLDPEGFRDRSICTYRHCCVCLRPKVARRGKSWQRNKLVG